MESSSISLQLRIDLLKVPRTNALFDIVLVEKSHQLHKPGLRNLLLHCSALDCLDLGMRIFLLLGRQTVDVIQDVDRFVDVERAAHFAEHVVLWFALLAYRG